jgi:hypothetical protein
MGRTGVAAHTISVTNAEAAKANMQSITSDRLLSLNVVDMIACIVRSGNPGCPPIDEKLLIAAAEAYTETGRVPSNQVFKPSVLCSLSARLPSFHSSPFGLLTQQVRRFV